MEDAPDVAECAIDRDIPKLVIWSDDAQRQHWADTSKHISCALGQGFGDSSFSYVAGVGWSVTDTSPKLADKIVGAIGGHVVRVECEQGPDSQ